jgi:hypothetical protein
MPAGTASGAAPCSCRTCACNANSSLGNDRRCAWVVTPCWTCQQATQTETATVLSAPLGEEVNYYQLVPRLRLQLGTRTARNDRRKHTDPSPLQGGQPSAACIRRTSSAMNSSTLRMLIMFEALFFSHHGFLTSTALPAAHSRRPAGCLQVQATQRMVGQIACSKRMEKDASASSALNASLAGTPVTR